MKNRVNLIVFICVLIISLFLPVIKAQLFIKIIITVIPIILTTYLYFKNFKLFVPTLFFTINALFSPFISNLINRYELNIPQICFLLPIIIYSVIVLNIEALKKEITWWKRGKFDKITIVLIFIVIILSSVSLIAWVYLAKQDLSEYLKFIPDIPFILLVMYGIAFPIFNAFFEEFIARAVLFDGFSKIFTNIVPVILCQAVIFAIWHYRGFPGGLTGVIMVFIWSVFLGIIRYRSEGMLAPLIAHFFADLSISVIVLFVFILPEKMGIL